jgi:hypothetical protein
MRSIGPPDRGGHFERCGLRLWRFGNEWLAPVSRMFVVQSVCGGSFRTARVAYSSDPRRATSRRCQTREPLRGLRSAYGQLAFGRSHSRPAPTLSLRCLTQRGCKVHWQSDQGNEFGNCRHPIASLCHTVHVGCRVRSALHELEIAADSAAAISSDLRERGSGIRPDPRHRDQTIHASGNYQSIWRMRSSISAL